MDRNGDRIIFADHERHITLSESMLVPEAIDFSEAALRQADQLADRLHELSASALFSSKVEYAVEARRQLALLRVSRHIQELCAPEIIERLMADIESTE